MRVESVAHVTDLDTALALDPLHAWTPDVVKQRFNYRAPGLFVLAVRAFRLAQPKEVVERPEYAGCKTWVALDPPVDVPRASEVVSDEAFAEFMRTFQTITRGKP